MPPDRDELDTLPPELPPELPPALPPALVAELRRIDREQHRPGVPAHVDAAVRAGAVAHFASVEGADAPVVLVFPTWARWARRVAAAAVIATGAGLWWVGLDADLSSNITTAQANPGDLNRDGQRNIIDAMVLAQTLRDTNNIDTNISADFNNDGQTNTLDVDALAQRIVSLRDQWTHNAIDAIDATQHAFTFPFFALEVPVGHDTPSSASEAWGGGA